MREMLLLDVPHRQKARKAGRVPVALGILEEELPRFFQALTYAVPARYFFVIIRGIMLKGAGLRELWPQAAALLGLGTVILTLAVTRFRKKLE